MYEQRIVGYRSRPGQVQGDCYGEVCTVTDDELIIPGAKRERVRLTAIGAVHHERDKIIAMPVVTSFLSNATRRMPGINWPWLLP